MRMDLFVALINAYYIAPKYNTIQIIIIEARRTEKIKVVEI